ncbi:MmcQ/YjbR family DNA-binding protein [Shimazuella sp. AN120528]|uniref:MmcQ/YjbR family DNA-binding protein n=1 Tax=Shimazuella soli TaxID=1892854 RepID=UPI001F0FFE00|nr:MmcQ/YjbR family DNA-binding protein [Shimazuella soli]MCH5585421.1 MmcQ/YjbR family DNA-binding protein [Shimazuella soli]
MQLQNTDILHYVRKICSNLSEVMEHKDGFGYVTFQVHGKSFVKITDRAGLCFKSNREMQELLIQESKFFKTPYIGRHGWVSIRNPQEEDWTYLMELIQEAYLRAAPKYLGQEWRKLNQRKLVEEK